LIFQGVRLFLFLYSIIFWGRVGSSKYLAH